MPFAMQFDIQRAGLAEQFVQRLNDAMPQSLNELLGGIERDISAHAPRGSGENPKVGDIKLSESFYVIPAQPMGEGVWEGYIASRAAAKARAQEYGSGLYGPNMSKYPIRPKNARFLSFQKEGKTLVLPMVMHPGVHGQWYINETLRIWRPAVARKYGDTIRLAAVSRGWMRGIL